MRKSLFPFLIAAALAGCNAGDSAMSGARQFGAGVGAAATAPLDDLNLRREYIPTVLLQAEANPYDLRNLNHCATIGAEIARLNEALGPDSDEPPAPDGSFLSERAADAAANAALDAIRDAATDFIPGRSWVRQLSGAEQHSRHVQSAIEAGRLRRAFLKGTGMQRNCAPPAAPAWFRPRGGGQR
ncbi:membrane lipoprotein lipid attachment site-containing protein [Brevundimonas sp.]|uniref:membrane lipoprotein lipid attachment site-containing protein n=1 Tax=Brevundimonas sp. TaxID=1871086 RepID=UPI002FC9CC53